MVKPWMFGVIHRCLHIIMFLGLKDEKIKHKMSRYIVVLLKKVLILPVFWFSHISSEVDDPYYRLIMQNQFQHRHKTITNARLLV